MASLLRFGFFPTQAGCEDTERDECATLVHFTSFVFYWFESAMSAPRFNDIPSAMSAMSMTSGPAEGDDIPSAMSAPRFNERDECAMSTVCLLVRLKDWFE